MKIRGACHCGTITYEAEVDPETARICHCTDCQVLSGAVFRFGAHAERGTFRLLSGTPRIYVKLAESGNPREQAFCEICGTPIYSASPGPEPRRYTLRAGTIAERAALRPRVQIWRRSRLPWVDELPGVPCQDKQD
jgi:hypothetical protein